MTAASLTKSLARARDMNFRAQRRDQSRRVSALGGFRLTGGFTLLYLSLLVLLPLSALMLKTLTASWTDIWKVISSARVIASYKLSLGAAFLAASINAVFGLLLAWILVRYKFFGSKLVDALIDLPFALPTAVAGLALTALYSENGWLGRYLVPLGIKVAFTPLGVLVALTFIGLPFLVRTVQPVLIDLDRSYEEVGETLGANAWQRFRYIILPTLIPALLTGFALAFARALGEYGSVIFIAGNIPMVSEITPLMIITQLEQYDYSGATAIAVVLLATSFVLLLLINSLGAWSQRYRSQEGKA